jgi:DNA (cytosine-5)-methyltransferase 1
MRVKHVIKNITTGAVFLRGHRLKRNKYTGQLLNCTSCFELLCVGSDRKTGKLNELAMILRVREGDTRCALVAGLEDVAVEEVLRTRECILTNKPYPFLSFRDGNRCSFPASLSKAEIKAQVFNGGILVCRVVHVTFISKNGKPYSGIVRMLHSREADPTGETDVMGAAHASRAESILLSDDEDEEDSQDRSMRDLSRGMSTLGRRARSTSADHGSRKRRSPSMPQKPIRYTFGDAFCGAGGASQGAKQAGYSVMWGMDLDEYAIDAYSNNHVGALPFQLNAHNFPPKGYTGKKLRVDVLHLSPPCCFFSPAK